MRSFTLEKKEANIKENDIIVSDNEYISTPGLCEPMVASTLNGKIFTNVNYDNNAEIMHSTNALRRKNDESETKPKAKSS